MTFDTWLLLLGQLPWFGWVELAVNSMLRLLEAVFVWPVAIFAVAFMFRRALRDLIDSLVRVKFHDTEIELHRNWRNVETSGEVIASEQVLDPEAVDQPPTPPAEAKKDPAKPVDLEAAILDTLPDTRRVRRIPSAARNRIAARQWINTSDETRPRRWREIRIQARVMAYRDPAEAADTIFFTFMEHTLEATLPPRKPEEGRVWPDALTGHYPPSWIQGVRNLRSILQDQRSRMTTEEALEIIAQLDELLLQHVIITKEHLRTPEPPQPEGQDESASTEGNRG